MNRSLKSALLVAVTGLAFLIGTGNEQNAPREENDSPTTPVSVKQQKRYKPGRGVLYAIGGDFPPEDNEDIEKSVPNLKELLARKKGFEDIWQDESLWYKIDPSGLWRHVIGTWREENALINGSNKDLKPKIVLIPSASESYNELHAKNIIKRLAWLGLEPKVVNPKNPEESNNPESVKAVKEGNIIYTGGGGQDRLWKLIPPGSDLYKAIVEFLETPGKVFGGSSAGAAILDGVELQVDNKVFRSAMVNGGDPDKLAAVLAKMHESWNLLPDVEIAFDTHFGNRQRWARLAEMARRNRKFIGFGLDEATGVNLYTSENGEIIIKAFGRRDDKEAGRGKVGKVYAIYGKDIKYPADKCVPINTMPFCGQFDSQMKMRILYPGQYYQLSSHDIIPASVAERVLGRPAAAIVKR